jgi:hypothetical protein
VALTRPFLWGVEVVIILSPPSMAGISNGVKEIPPCFDIILEIIDESIRNFESLKIIEAL